MFFSGPGGKSYYRGSMGIAVAAILLFIALPFFYAPTFLAYSDPPRKADAVILFLGPGWDGRQKEATQLLREGYVEYLFVPGHHLAYALRDGELEIVNLDSRGVFPKPHRLFLNSAAFPSGKWPDIPRNLDSEEHPDYLENTHIELIRARKMMEGLGKTTALLVSSPLHMRRIRLIAERVFENPPDSNGGQSAAGHSHPADLSPEGLAFIPTRYEKAPGAMWFLNVSTLKKVSLEYVKIAWFGMYSLLDI